MLSGRVVKAVGQPRCYHHHWVTGRSWVRIPQPAWVGLGFSSREEIPMVFPDRKCFVIILHPTRSPRGQFVAVCYCCKINKVWSFKHKSQYSLARKVSIFNYLCVCETYRKQCMFSFVNIKLKKGSKYSLWSLLQNGYRGENKTQVRNRIQSAHLNSLQRKER